MEATGHSNSPIKTLARLALIVMAMCFFLYIQFRVQIGNGFSTLYGDSYDSAIVVAILEHWSNVFRGSSQWSQLYYFYPYKNTLAQTDGYFLVGIIYSIIRQFGLDPFISSEFSNMTVRAIGYLGFYWMIRSVFRVGYGWAIFSAGLFLIANNLTVHGTRVQLATLAFAPFVAVLLNKAYTSLMARRRLSLLGWGSGAGAALGAWAITCFYITWFFLFFALVLSVVLYVSASATQRSALLEVVKEQRLALLAIAMVAVVSMLPLLSVYLPKAAESGVRPYESALNFAVTLPGILQVGETNVMFGHAYTRFLAWAQPGYQPMGEYYNTGVAPILFVFFCLAVVTSYARRQGGSVNRLVWSVAVATIITWLCVIKVGTFSLWYLVYHTVPGAKALNVIGAYQIFLIFPILVVVTLYLEKWMPRFSSVTLILIGIVLVVEELNDAYIVLDRQAEVEKITGLVGAPQQCSFFYVSSWGDQVTPTAKIYAHNVSAMIIAELLRMPTINGFASFNPPDWNFANPDSDDYDNRMRSYAYSHQINRVCKLDLPSKQWQLIVP